MQQYYVITLHSDFARVLEWVRLHGLEHECHLARTRFWVPEGAIRTEFLLRFGHCTASVESPDPLHFL